MSNKEQMIANRFNGDVEAYKAWLRALGSKGGKLSKSPADHPTRFDNLNPELVRQFGTIGGKKSRKKPIDLDKR